MLHGYLQGIFVLLRMRAMNAGHIFIYMIFRLAKRNDVYTVWARDLVQPMNDCDKIPPQYWYYVAHNFYVLFLAQ